MFALLALLATSDVAAAPVDTEVIVYSDDFARWNQTRWAVQSQVVLPVPILLGTDENIGFQTYATQVSLVLACAIDGPGKRRAEVLCEIEDVGLRATSVRRWGSTYDRGRAQQVLDEVDAKLTGASVQLQVDHRGGVRSVQLEGLDPRNRRQRGNQENLRQLFRQVMSGFHLQLPDHAQVEGTYTDRDPELMTLPSLTGSMGFAKQEHVVRRIEEEGRQLQIVHTAARSHTEIQLPRWVAPDVSPRSHPGESASEGESPELSTPGFDGGESLSEAQPVDPHSDPEQAGPMQPRRPTGPADVWNIDPDADPFRGSESAGAITLAYDMQATAVAVFDRSDGVMTERVWVSSGTPTASSAGGTLNSRYRNVGSLRRLDDGEAFDVGVSGQIMPPAQPSVAGLPAWEPLDVGL